MYKLCVEVNTQGHGHYQNKDGAAQGMPDSSNAHSQGRYMA
jgi:hypothetical protein